MKISNTLDETIEEIHIGVAYYDAKGALIDFVSSKTISLEGKLTGTLNIDYPKDAKNKTIAFKDYVVYVNEMYSKK